MIRKLIARIIINAIALYATVYFLHPGIAYEGGLVQLLVAGMVLGLLNVMPIPVLDGGYILITLVEAVIRRPIPQRVLIPILTTFMLMFFTLFGFLFYNDFMNWIVKQ